MKPKILFVDDDKNILQGLRRSLFSVRKKWDIHFSEGGEKGLEELKKATYDVVISDMRMPDMDGAAFLEIVSREYPGIVRLVLSGQADKLSTYRSIGPSHQFLSKPFDADQLIKKLSRILLLRSKLTEEASKAITGLRCFPSPIGTREKLRKIMEEQKDEIEPIAKAIADDVGLSIKTLQLTNSSYFGIGAEVYCPIHAARMLDVDILSDLIEEKRFSVPLAKNINEGNFRDISEVGFVIAKNSRQEAENRGFSHSLQALSGAVGLFSVLADLLPMTEQGSLMGQIDDTAVAYMLTLWGMPNTLIDMFDEEATKSADVEEVLKIVAHVREASIAMHIANSDNHVPLGAVG